MFSDLLVFLFEVVDALLLVSDGFFSLPNLLLVSLLCHGQGDDDGSQTPRIAAVSYTHLTLPTKA